MSDRRAGITWNSDHSKVGVKARHSADGRGGFQVAARRGKALPTLTQMAGGKLLAGNRAHSSVVVGGQIDRVPSRGVLTVGQYADSGQSRIDAARTAV